jgi:hypothetical protein
MSAAAETLISWFERNFVNVVWRNASDLSKLNTIELLSTHFSCSLQTMGKVATFQQYRYGQFSTSVSMIRSWTNQRALRRLPRDSYAASPEIL